MPLLIGKLLAGCVVGVAMIFIVAIVLALWLGWAALIAWGAYALLTGVFHVGFHLAWLLAALLGLLVVLLW